MAIDGDHRLAVRRLGGHAERVLAGGARGRVIAVFDRSFYVELGGRLACFGARDLSDGPVNVVSGAPRGTDWAASGVRTGDGVAVSCRSIRVGPRFVFALDGAETWRPGPTPDWTPATLDRGLAAINACIAGRLPEEGLGALILPDGPAARATAVLRAAAAPIACLCNWLQRAMRDDGAAMDDGLLDILPLLGLGPGLTPSGDDLLGGAMIALGALGHHRARDRMARVVGRHARYMTTPISVAHLAAAAEGAGGASVHALLNAALCGDGPAIVLAVNRIAKVGHSSGWDTLAGVITVLAVGRPRAADAVRAKPSQVHRRKRRAARAPRRTAGQRPASRSAS